MSDPHPPRKRFHHVGLRAHERQPDEHYVPAEKVWVTDPNWHPSHVEWRRYEPDSPTDEEFMDAPHVAYEVDELEPHLAGKELYRPPHDLGDPPFATAAIAREHGLFVEYLQFKPGRAWHGR
jgi:hypothetical protein